MSVEHQPPRAGDPVEQAVDDKRVQPAPSKMNITSHDVAREAGVSQSTVSRVLRDTGRVSAQTRERVVAAAARLGYVPSEVGRSLVTRSTRTIAIVITDFESVLYPYLIAPLHNEAWAHGYRIVLLTEEVEPLNAGRASVVSAQESEGALNPLLDRLLNGSTDGVVLTTSRLDGTIPRVLARRALPFVFLTRFVEGIAADSAVVDNSLGASLATSEAMRLGHVRFGGIFGPRDTSTGRDRERGTRAALSAAGMELPDQLTRYGPFTYETGYQGMLDVMAQQPPPTIVICANDTIAIGAYNATHTLGLSVPDDVSLVGFDDLPLAGWEVFGLTTVHQPLEDMARTAVRLLIERIEGRVSGDAVRQMVFEPRLIVRRTLAPPPPERSARR